MTFSYKNSVRLGKGERIHAYVLGPGEVEIFYRAGGEVVSKVLDTNLKMAKCRSNKRYGYAEVIPLGSANLCVQNGLYKLKGEQNYDV